MTPWGASGTRETEWEYIEQLGAGVGGGSQGTPSGGGGSAYVVAGTFAGIQKL